MTKGEALFALPEHAVVFTHGDLSRMIGPRGSITGIFDWEAAAWLPEYWEMSVTNVMRMRGRRGQSLDRRVSSGVYEEEIKGHRSIFPLISDALSY